MSNSTTNLDLISASQANKEVTANSLFDAASPAMLYGRRAVTTAGLTWGYYGGTVMAGGVPTQIANGTVALTPSATNYLEADPSTGAVTVNTTGFTPGRTPLYQVITVTATVTSYADLRILGGSNAPVTSVNGHTGAVTLGASDVGADASGTASDAIAAHDAATDPHPQYLTQTEGDVRYALTSSGVSDGDKGDIVVSGSGTSWAIKPGVLSTFGRSLIDDADAATARATLGLGSAATLSADTDTALAANSDTRAATQKAVKAYIDNTVTGGAAGVMVFKGTIDCSANPNYPAANAGAVYKVSVAGRLGGASGVVVEVGDTAYCTSAAASGDQATVGSSWNVVQENIDGAVAGPTSATDSHVALFNGATGKLIKDSGLTLAGTNTGDETVTTTGTLIHGATAKTALVDADEMDLTDSAASFVMKKITWANIKATLKTYFDALYAPISQPFDLTAFYPGVPPASAKVTRVPVARAVSFPANFSGSVGVASVAATTSTAFDVQKNGTSVGTITFAAGATTATFSTSGAVSFAAGDILAIITPASPDATLADPGFVLSGSR